MQRAVIEKEYVLTLKEILYLDYVESSPLSDQNQDWIVNRGHHFRIFDKEELEIESLPSQKFEVVGWVDQTLSCPYDFILFDPQSNKYYLANLRGRTDGWPLFAIQEGRKTCSRSHMGSEWNCRLCVKYFGEVCKGR